MSEPVRLEHAERVRDFYRNQGAVKEQERIIKLLEENTGCGYQHRETEMCFCEAIALIKGETNG